MQKEEEIVVNSAPVKKSHLGLILTIVGIFVILILLIAITIAMYYLLQPKATERNLEVDANIPQAIVYNESICMLSLADAINLTNIKSLKFVFENWSYIASEFKKDYEIKAIDLGLNDFKAIKKVNAEIEYYSILNPPINGTAPQTNLTPNCTDGIKNGGETGVDCGGSCKACSPGPGEPTCTAKTCSNYSGCGSFDDNCGGTITCGCGSGQYCSSGQCISGTPETYKIMAAAGSGGRIVPNGTLYINSGNDLSFSIIPDAGYIISDVKTSGVAEGAIPIYIMRNIQANNSIDAYFIPEANVIPETIYVDNQLISDCNKTYSIANRDCSGNDGDAYKTIGRASDTAGVGDAVLIRGGVYNYGNETTSLKNALWPKHSGTPQNPITFKNYPGEEPVIGRGQASFPNDYEFSISRAVISLRNVHDIIIEGLKADYVAGWIYARGCSNIIIRNNIFINSTWASKGTARFIDSNYNKIINNTFLDAGANGDSGAADALQIVASNYNLIENNTFISATHALLAIRCGNFNVIRNNYFSNPWYANGNAEKLTEEYDCRFDRNDPANPSYIAYPQYDNTSYNLFENNWFGYHPDYPLSFGKGSRTSAMQFSGQNTIIRNNIYSNPPLKQPDPLYPAGSAGGVAIIFRWGGSWDGWDNASQKLIGEGPEAGFVHGNRIYNNVFNGYDGSKMIFAADNSVDNLPNPPPMKSVKDYWNYPFDHGYIFGDNVIKNNIFTEGRFLARNTWLESIKLNQTPVQLLIRGNMNTTLFENNCFFASPPNEDQLIEYSALYYPPKDPAFFNVNYSGSFNGNLQQNPGFVDANNEVFKLQSGSAMINAGAFLTKTAGAGSGTTMQVSDAGYFYDGYGISGEVGDLIQLEGQTTTARIIKINYATNTLTLDRSLTWTNGEGVSLAYSGSKPDIGAFEYSGVGASSAEVFSLNIWSWLKGLFNN